MALEQILFSIQNMMKQSYSSIVYVFDYNSFSLPQLIKSSSFRYEKTNITLLSVLLLKIF